jgi:hypothetical protein
VNASAKSAYYVKTAKRLFLECDVLASMQGTRDSAPLSAMRTCIRTIDVAELGISRCRNDMDSAQRIIDFNCLVSSAVFST